MSSEVPEGWRVMPFSEAVAINPKRRLPNDGLVPFLDMASLPLNGADVSVLAEREVGSGGSKFQSGDTLFARITPCAENGKLGFVQSVDGGEVAQGSTEFIVMAGRDGLTLPEYVRYLAGWSEVRDQAIGLMEGTSGRQRVPNWAFDEIEVLIPPLDEQQRIAEALRSIDEQTELTRRTLAATKATKNAALITALRTNSWPTVQVGNLLADTRTPMRSGPFGSALLKSELTESGVPLLGIDNVHAERFVPEYRRFVSEAKYQELTRYTVFPGDVMVTIMGTVGRCCVAPEGVGRAISSKHVWTITLDKARYSPSLLAWQINHEPRVLEQLRGSAQGGIMSAISSETLRNLRVPQPPRAQVLELEHLITSANSAISLLEAELASLARLKQLVSSDLLSDRVRLPALAPAASTARAVQPAFKRAVFAAEVVHQLHRDDRFGSVKHEKIVHLCELHLGLQDDLDRRAYKEAAGPYDPSARRSVERIFRRQKWFNPIRQDKRVVYEPLENSGSHVRYFDRYFGDRRAEVQKIIDLLRPMKTEQCEIVATLYAVWNDFLIDGHQPTDDEIVHGVLSNWTESKRKIIEDRWRSALGWMREKGLIPSGQGEKTRVAAT